MCRHGLIISLIAVYPSLFVYGDVDLIPMGTGEGSCKLSDKITIPCQSNTQSDQCVVTLTSNKCFDQLAEMLGWGQLYRDLSDHFKTHFHYDQDAEHYTMTYSNQYCNKKVLHSGMTFNINVYAHDSDSDSDPDSATQFLGSEVIHVPPKWFKNNGCKPSES